jgi:hypothetical protein
LHFRKAMLLRLSACFSLVIFVSSPAVARVYSHQILQQCQTLLENKPEFSKLPADLEKQASYLRELTDKVKQLEKEVDEQNKAHFGRTPRFIRKVMLQTDSPRYDRIKRLNRELISAEAEQAHLGKAFQMALQRWLQNQDPQYTAVFDLLLGHKHALHSLHRYQLHLGHFYMAAFFTLAAELGQGLTAYAGFHGLRQLFNFTSTTFVLYVTDAATRAQNDNERSNKELGYLQYLITAKSDVRLPQNLQLKLPAPKSILGLKLLDFVLEMMRAKEVFTVNGISLLTTYRLSTQLRVCYRARQESQWYAANMTEAIQVLNDLLHRYLCSLEALKDIDSPLIPQNPEDRESRESVELARLALQQLLTGR